MLKREISKFTLKTAKEYPVLTVMGPRQSGKTTLVKMLFPRHEYVNLEEPDMREFARKHPRDFFKNYAGNLIIDEFQRVPELLSYIQVMADNENKKGRFVLTGSHQPRIRESVSQTLAGRTALITLLPMSIKELGDNGIFSERDEYVCNGFMPRVYSENVTPKHLYQNYYSTYVERDVRQLINVGNQNAFERFMKLLAGRAGQIVNLNSLAGDAGVSQPTLSSWISVLEASFIVFRLPCYFENFGKRQIKSPKIYFTEVGLAAYLLGIETPEQAFRDPLAGSLFENMVVAEMLKAMYNRGKNADIYYFRNQHGLEIDLILNKRGGVVPIEIKSSASFDLSFSKNLKTFADFSPKVQKGCVIYAGDKNFNAGGVKFLNFKETSSLIA